MDWSKLGSVAGKLAAANAPTLGRLAGELIPIPFGGTIGELIGKAIANAMGVEETPEAVEAAVNNTPSDILAAKLAATESEAATKWAALAEIAKADAADRTSQSNAINETIRSEVAQGVKWYHWRHLLGYVPVAIGFEVVTLFPLMAFGKITAADMAAVIAAITPFLTIVAALLGYVAQDTTKLKTTAMTGEHAPTVVGVIAKAIKKK